MKRSRTYVALHSAGQFPSADARCECGWHQMHHAEKSKVVGRATSSLKTHARMKHGRRLKQVIVVEAA